MNAVRSNELEPRLFGKRDEEQKMRSTLGKCVFCVPIHRSLGLFVSHVHIVCTWCLDSYIAKFVMFRNHKEH